MLFALHDITKMYGRITALRQLTVSVETGAVGLLGPNGAGKTTLIRALLGLLTLDSGHGQVLGLDIRARRLDIRQAVGFVPEDECLFPGVPGIEFVSYCGELCGMSRSDALQRAHEVLNYVGLGEARYRAVESYSTGMKQRLKLAGAIVHDPRLLILDEPTNGMDPRGREEILELARDLAHNKGMSLLFSSHLLPDVESVCERVLVLGRGRLLAQGTIRELKKAYEHAYEVRVKNDPVAFAEHLRGAGCAVEIRNDTLVVRPPFSRSERSGEPEMGIRTAPQLSSTPVGPPEQLVWRTAARVGEQVRHLRPLRSTLEDVFLKALDEGAGA